MNALPATNPQLASPRQAAMAVLACWFVISAFAVPLIVIDWAERGNLPLGIVRAVAFEVAFSCICGAGYALYRRQGRDQTAEPQPFVWETAPAAGSLRSALLVGVAIQVTFLFFAALMLDFGRALHVARVASYAYWAMIGLIFLRRENRLTRIDEIAIRYGYLPILMLVGQIGPIVWRALQRW